MAKKKNTKGKNILWKALAIKKAAGKRGKKPYKRIMGRWGGHKFIVSSKKIESFTDLTVKGSCETETKKDSSGKQKYTVKKNGNAVEVSMNIQLNAFLGVDVRKEAMAWVKEARQGKQSYFYVGKKKLVASKLVLKSANVKNIEMSPGGRWISADVAITLEQSTKKNSGSGGNSENNSGGGGGGSGSPGGGGGNYGGGKRSVRNTSPVTTGRSTLTDQQAKNMQGNRSTLTDQQRKYINGGNNRVSWLTDQQKKNIREAAQKKSADEETVRRARQKGLP